jgi:hypothetical protein
MMPRTYGRFLIRHLTARSLVLFIQAQGTRHKVRDASFQRAPCLVSRLKNSLGIKIGTWGSLFESRTG